MDPNPYLQFVRTVQKATEDAARSPLGAAAPSPKKPAAADAPRVLLFSPHPDDEVVVGGLALRLMRESGWQVTNVAVTLGSKKERRRARLEELRRCCDWIGFDLLTAGPHGLEGIHPAGRQERPADWRRAVDVVADVLRERHPQAILFPHAKDWNSTHEGVHALVCEALTQQASDFCCTTVETEFWGAMPSPNLMVEITAEQLGDLITALTFHVGEVRRNPYHLTLPGWMIDNVRRGAELVGGQGGASPDFLFATLYRLRRWTAGSWEPCWTGGRTLDGRTSAGSLFKTP